VQPSLQDINLMDYYWISRDKLENTINAEAMVSQIVRLIHKSISTFTTQSSLKSEIQKINQLLDNERTVLFNMIGSDLLDHPDDDRCYSIIHSIIDNNHSEMMVIYKEVLFRIKERIKDSLIPPSVALGMKDLAKKDASFLTLINSFNTTSRISKALKVQLKKQ
jgi:hypothetical protein